jgi:hypothetical protein
MCFSTTASFTSFAVLTTVGAAGLKYVKKPSQQFFAAIPFLFAVQQLTEGFVWIGLLNNSNWKTGPIQLFIFFAQVLWAFWVPFAILKMEIQADRIRIMKGCLWIGIFLAIYISYCLINYETTAIFSNYHINYKLYFPHQYYPILGLLYLLPIIIPPLASSVPEIRLIGVLLLFSFIITKLVFEDEVISVWCFFAAIISSIVYWVLRNHSKKNLTMNHSKLME